MLIQQSTENFPFAKPVPERPAVGKIDEFVPLKPIAMVDQRMAGHDWLPKNPLLMGWKF